MGVVGRVESVWRYPVKSMGGEKLESAFVGFAGLYGDRIFAFHNSAAVAGFPFLTGREHAAMLPHRPRFRHRDKATSPPNLAAAQHLAPGVTPLYASLGDLAVDVETPGGPVLALESSELLERLARFEGAGQLRLLKSERALTDCRPLSLISTQTVDALGTEIGASLDGRRFRANVYLDLGVEAAHAEDTFIGKRIKIGPKAIFAVLERDPRCRMITLDPDDGHASPEILECVAKRHQGRIGVYAAVLVEGTIRPDDEVLLLS